MRTNISTGTPWEDRVGYSRAVRVGPLVYVTGTLAADDQGNMIGVGDPKAQTLAALEKIRRALEEAGAGLADVVRTRLYVTDIDQWEQIAVAHREYFGSIRPCTTMVEVSRLFTPEALVEIEVDAVVGDL
jgi:enamine deaminase RidA (YjgF/YER057c/UK114 family)